MEYEIGHWSIPRGISIRNHGKPGRFVFHQVYLRGHALPYPMGAVASILPKHKPILPSAMELQYAGLISLSILTLIYYSRR